MERFLIAYDASPGCHRIVEYLVRILKDNRDCEFFFFHILPTTSPDKLRKEEVQRIERIHLKRLDLGGYFWKEEDEKNMERSFALAKEILAAAGFPEAGSSFHFTIESGDLADIIFQKARELECNTMVLGRRHLSRVKEFLLGSVSSTVLRMARGRTVWVVET